MTNIVLPTFPALASGALFVKGFAYTGAAPAAYVSFGHSFQIGQLPAGSSLGANFGAGAPILCQVDVKTTYADGSAAWAIVTVHAPAVSAAGTVWGQFSLAAASTAPTLGLGTALGSTALVLTLAATTPAQTFTTDLVALVKSAAFDPWLNGPLAVQGRAMVTLYQGLRAQVDLTAYADGTVNASVVVANDIAMLPAAGTVNYTATVSLNGAVAYTSPALTHYQYQNWRVQVGTRGALPRVIHNPADFISAQCILPYDLGLGVDPTVQQWLAGIAAPGPLQPGPVDQSMGDQGGRGDIGMNCGWSVPWFLTMDAACEQGALNVAAVAGSVPWHMFNASTGTWLNTDDIPNLWTQPGDPSGCTLLTQPVPDAGGWSLDSSHNPDLCYIAALLTGDRYWVDEVNAMAAWHIGSFWPAPRQNGQGLLSDIQMRAAAWSIRDLTYSAYLSPPDSIEGKYAREILTNNLVFFNGWTPQLTQVQGEPAGYLPNWWYGPNLPPWEDDFFFAAVGLAATMGFPGALELCRWKAGFTVGRFLQTAFDPKNGVCYNLSLFANANDGWPSGGASNAVPGSGSGLLTTWAAIQSTTVANGQANTGSTTWPASNGYYAQNAWISLTLAMTLSIPNAAQAFSWLESSGAPFIDPTSWATSNEMFRTVARTLNASEVFAATASPPAVTVAAIGLSGTSLAAAAPAGTTVGAISVTMSDGSAFAGALALGGSAAADFAINGANLLTASDIAAGSYPITITATPTNTAIAPLTVPFTITEAAQALPTIRAITLSDNVFSYGVQSGVVIGIIGVTMSDGTAFAGALSLTGPTAEDFAIGGPSATFLETAAALAPGSYSIGVVATPSNTSIAPMTQMFTVTGAAETAAQLVATAQADFAKVVSAAAAIGKAAAALKTTEAENLEAAIVAMAGQVTAAEKLLAAVTADLAAVAGAV